jgi:hypothetical protein
MEEQVQDGVVSNEPEVVTEEVAVEPEAVVEAEPETLGVSIGDVAESKDGLA